MEYFEKYPPLVDRVEMQLAMLTQATIAPYSKKSLELQDFMITGQKDIKMLEGQELENFIFERLG
ncbi:hypothetical protein NJU99_08915 [Arcobacter roscoffensis]|uniref:Uncharacterized protein n=2 Tax=Arcobacter roscoffensis TaxID=2961520 RepID=A0ABY5E2W7_9BACT|nr:hypothetical protein [Arcobacter roscoffensis]UTJ05388.1 hypothetical protein NJU99_08915 [Arcobacter roscoffensis]